MVGAGPSGSAAAAWAARAGRDVLVIDAASADACAATLRAAGEQVYTIGAIAARGNDAAVLVR